MTSLFINVVYFNLVKKISGTMSTIDIDQAIHKRKKEQLEMEKATFGFLILFCSILQRPDDFCIFASVWKVLEGDDGIY